MIPLLVVLALVGLTWSPLIARATSPSGRLYDVPWSLWLPAGGLVLAVWVRGWLGLAVAYVVVRAIHAGHESALWTSVYFALGVGLLTMVRGAPREFVRWSLLLCVAFEIAWSFVWRGGTLAQPAFLGAAVAAVLPLSPWWAWPLLALGIVWSKSYLAALAVLVGALVRWPEDRLLIVALASVAVISYGLVTSYKSLYSTGVRLDLWRAGLTDMTPLAWMIGYGPGGWGSRMWRHDAVPGHLFTAAHHEPLQWLYETGMVGVALLVGWCRESARWVARAPAMWRGAFASVAVLSCGLQVFHLPTLAPVMVLVLGGALHSEGELGT